MDLTTPWVTLQKHRGHIGWLIVVLLAFIVGWQTGRVMSPYYASHPIVFSEKPEL